MNKNDNNLYDAAIIGGGPAGLTAAIYLARALYRVLVIEKEKFGGQITITAEVVNYPGYESISGIALTERMRKQGEYFGAEYMLAEVTDIDLGADVKVIKTSRGDVQCLSVLLATGAHPRMVGFRNEEAFKGHGVAYCATCDGEFFTDKEVFVVGGGFAAAEESVFLTRYASHVTILIRGADFKCAKETANEARNHPKITVLTNTSVDSVEGDNIIRSITYHNNKTGEKTVYSPANGDSFGVFVFAGYLPSTDLVKGKAELDERGYIITDHSQKTTADGLYAAGDVCIKPLRQVVTATGDGALAATEMEKYISAMRQKTGLKPQQIAKRPPIHKVIDSGSEKRREIRAGSSTGADGIDKTGSAESMGGKNSEHNWNSSDSAAGASGNGVSSDILSDEMKSQLQNVFSSMQKKLILQVHNKDEMLSDEKLLSDELIQYMREISALTEKLSVKVVKDGDDLPCVSILSEEGVPLGYTFHGVPGGHEFTSFILTLYNLSGPGQSLPEETKTRALALRGKIHMQIMVSLTCTMCPDLVTAAGRIVSLNPKVSIDIYDINRFPEKARKYNVMSVPCFIINGQAPEFGRKTIDQLLTLFERALSSD